MKTLARISGLTVTITICCLGSKGPALWCVITVGAIAMAALFVASSRLGYFDRPSRAACQAEVVSLDERRLRSRGSDPDDRCAAGSAGVALRGR